PSVAALAAEVDALRLGEAAAAPPIVPVPRDGPLPLSFAQERLWFLDRLRPGEATYNVPIALELDGELDAGALAGSLDEIVRRHEVLRTTFERRGGRPVQIVAPEGGWPVAWADLSGLPDAEREDAARQALTAAVEAPFDLGRGPLVRALGLTLEPRRRLLVLTLHHIVSDAWSARILTAEMGELYCALAVGAAGAPARLPELPVQYADFAVWQRRWLESGILAEQLAYWRQRLAGVGPLDLPADRPRPEVQGQRGGRCRLDLGAPLDAALLPLARRHGATLSMGVLAGFLALLWRYTGQPDLAVGAPVANRGRREVEDLIGFFVNTVVLRTAVAGGLSFNEMLARVRETALGAYAHQDVPFERLVEELRPRRDLSRTPLFQVLFDFHSVAALDLDLPGLVLRPFDVDSGTAKFDLSLTVVRTEGGLSAAMEYRTDLFDAATVERTLGHLRALLEGMAADPGRSLDELPLVSTPERRQLLEQAPPLTTPEPVYVAPQTAAEQAIAEVWRQVLGLERVGIHDNFFDLGGHSLLMVNVHARLRETVAPDLDMVDLFRYPTIHALAAHVSRPAAPRAPRPPGERARRQRAALDDQRRRAQSRAGDSRS
ncbi:MAG TPA: condensation domain-containing protein, partial [Thermoanaerobaculia bacterium]|nr:condensation domain-containing protein [Thermoanaerobaculia bacterium]